MTGQDIRDRSEAVMTESSHECKARHSRLRALWVPILLAAGGVAVAAEEVVVKAKNVEILTGKTGLSSAVATAANGERLTVLERDRGWLRVRTPAGKEGFVKEGALAGLVLTAGGRPLSGGAGSSGLNAGNAAKGIEPQAQDFATQNRISPQVVSLINHQLDIRKALEAQPAEYERFQKVGGVGSGR